MPSDNKAELAFYRFSREPGLYVGQLILIGRFVQRSCVYSGVDHVVLCASRFAGEGANPLLCGPLVPR